MSEATYQRDIQALTDTLHVKARALADYLVMQPPRREALQATLTFAWWCLGEGAHHAHDVQERMHRVHLARQSDGAHSGE